MGIMSTAALEGFRVCVLGTLAGVALAVPVGRALNSLPFGVSSTDALTFGVVILLMLTVGSAASLFPARRAARLEPIQVLRDE